MRRLLGGKLGAGLGAILVLIALLSPFSGVGVYADSGSVGGKPAHPDPKNPRTSTIFIKTIEPGTSTDDGVEVINNTSETKTIQVYAVDSVKSSGGAFACSQAADPIQDAGGWVKLSKKEITLGAGEKSVVDFKISAPQDASPCEHNACIVLQEKAESTLQSGIGLNFRTAIRAAILVPGDIVKKITPTSIEAVTKDKNVAITAKVKSESNVSLDTLLRVSLKPMIYGNGESQSNTFPVLRAEEAEWNFDFKRPFWGGFYKAGFVASYNADTTLTLGENGNGNLTEVAGPAKNVFIWPQPAALIIELIVLLLLILLLFLIPKKLIARRRVKKNWVDYRVKAGETVAEIAQRTGVRWKKLAKVNDLKAPYNLVPGSVIRVPAKMGHSVPVTEPASPLPTEPEVIESPEAEVKEKEVDPDLGSNEPNILEEVDEPESVEEIFEDDIPQEEIAAELAEKPKPAKKSTTKRKSTSKKIAVKPKK